MPHNRIRSDSTGTGVRADINVTPLVDVCLVLVIIFMVVTPMIREGPEVALPDVASASRLTEHSGGLVISVRADRTVWLGEERLDGDAMAAALARHAAGTKTAPVLLRADRNLPYGEVRAVIKRMAEAGLARAELAVHSDPPGR